MPALSKPAATTVLSTAEEVEEEPSLEPLKRKKMTKTKESELTPSKITLSDPPPSGSEDVPSLQTRVDPESEKSQGPPRAPSTTALEGVSL